MPPVCIAICKRGRGAGKQCTNAAKKGSDKCGKHPNYTTETEIKTKTGGAVQEHGIIWEEDLRKNVYGLTEEECRAIPRTSKFDIPAALNRLTPGKNISVKSTHTPNTVCMGDARRNFYTLISGALLHTTVVFYKQIGNIKKVVRIIEVDLTGLFTELFGTITGDELEELDRAVKLIPPTRRPTPEERAHLYSIRDPLQAKSGAMHLNIKCDTSQSRLQCSFNRFQEFLEAHPSRIVASSDTHEFRGGSITAEISSGKRVMNKSKSKAVDLSPDSPPISTDSAVPPCL
jgi:hypothetical protein